MEKGKSNMVTVEMGEDDREKILEKKAIALQEFYSRLIGKDVKVEIVDKISGKCELSIEGSDVQIDIGTIHLDDVPITL